MNIHSNVKSDIPKYKLDLPQHY